MERFEHLDARLHSTQSQGRADHPTKYDAAQTVHTLVRSMRSTVFAVQSLRSAVAHTIKSPTSDGGQAALEVDEANEDDGY